VEDDMDILTKKPKRLKSDTNGSFDYRLSKKLLDKLKWGDGDVIEQYVRDCSDSMLVLINKTKSENTDNANIVAEHLISYTELLERLRMEEKAQKIFNKKEERNKNPKPLSKGKQSALNKFLNAPSALKHRLALVENQLDSELACKKRVENSIPKLEQEREDLTNKLAQKEQKAKSDAPYHSPLEIERIKKQMFYLRTQFNHYKFKFEELAKKLKKAKKTKKF